MCGIVGFSGEREAAPVLLEGLRKLEYRGYDSAGIAVLNGDKIEMVKSQGVIRNLAEKTREGALLRGHTGIGHTRWATHGAPNDVNAHPHLSNDGLFAVVHNGIIENYAALKAELERLGYRFESETDTEIIANLLDYYYAGDIRAAVMKTVSRLVGSYGLGVLCADRPDTVIAVREKSPLILGIGVGENYFASDVTALVAHTRNVIYLDDGELAELTPAGITIFDCAGQPIRKEVSRVVWDIETAEKGGYEHFMLKEIMEQPRAIKATVEPRIHEGKIAFEGLELTPEYLSGIRSIVITACGSACYAGHVGRYIIEELCRVPTSVELA
ncbi:MAG: isomerizing glutamine--fructose-6-phosphate transaminase, partial [bacterium]